MFGVQSGQGSSSLDNAGEGGGSGGSRYATGMFFDPDIERLHITGSVYVGGSAADAADAAAGSNNSTTSQQQRRDCFLSSLQLPQSVDDRGPTWVRQNTYGSPLPNANSSVTCSSIFMGKHQGIRTYFLVGYTDVYPDFLVTTSASTSSSVERASRPTADVYGFVAELNFAASLFGGRPINDNNNPASTGTTTAAQLDRDQYPVAIIGNATDGLGLVVATVHSNVPYRNSMYKRYMDSQLETTTSQPDPDVTGAFVPPRFEKGCSVSITNWQQTKINENFVQGTIATVPQRATDNASSSPAEDSGSAAYDNLQPTWTKELRSREGDSVFLSSLLRQEDNGGALLVAGYTAGTSSDFGASRPDGTLDSFVTSLDPSTGATLRSMRLQSLANSTDLILGMCAPPPSSQEAANGTANATSNASWFYVVGMTNEPSESVLLDSASGSYKTFLLKLGVESFDLAWSVEINAVPAAGQARGDVMGWACTVTRDDALVYVAGTVKDGASLTVDGTTVATNSSGGDDIFVAQLRTGDGSVKFVRQMGTSENDWLASGDSLTTDGQGNALVLGNTRGSMFRQKAGSSSAYATTADVVVFSIDRRTGAHVEIMESSPNATVGTPNATSPDANRTSYNETNATAPTASPTDVTSRHSTEPPSSSPGWSLRGNRTDSPYVPSNSTSSTGNSSISNDTTGGAPSKVEPNAANAPPPSSSISDTILVASIAMLVVLIGSSCLALLVIRHRRQKAKTLERTVTHAEDLPGMMPHHQRSSHSSQRWAGAFGNRTRDGGRGANRNSYDEHHHDPTETSSYASYVSGETLRSSSLRQLDPDTLLRLDPSLRSGGSEEDEESYGRFGHPIPDEDLYHPSVSLNSVRRGGAASPVLSSRQSQYSRETIEQWDGPDVPQSDRTLAMPTLSSNDDGSYADSDTIPTSRDGDKDDDADKYLAARSGTTSKSTDFRERIDQVPSGDFGDDDTSMFDPSTIASASCVSSRPNSLRSMDLLLGRRRSRDSVDTGYSVDMLFAKLRKKRGIDPEPSHSNEDGEGSRDKMRGSAQDDDLSFKGGILS
jgi:hypothetical protein